MENSIEVSEHNLPVDVERYYEEWTNTYIEDFGNYFQALQTENPDDLMFYIGENLDLKEGMRVLDAGCGICGPAMGLCKKFDLDLEAITLSDSQVKYAKENVEAGKSDLKGKINVRRGDFHNLSQDYEAASFDVVYYLESLCHSHDPDKAIHEARKVLKDGGLIYIKDLFQAPRNPNNPEYVEYAIKATDEQFCLKARQVGDILNLLTKYGFKINFCREIEIPHSYDIGNAFTAKHLFKLKMDQEGPWFYDGFLFLQWLEIKAVKYY
ncbi:MAG: class I SAM-dependent methyltransferase [Bacteroidota bacterium]